jgi:hypothetical protein
MVFAESLTGIILIISGILVKINPNLIAGYNTLSETDKKKVDIKRLSTYMHNGLIIIGAVTIISSVVMYFLGVKASYRLIIITAFIILGILYMTLSSAKMKV